MAKYFIYFSATGNGDFIAESLREKGYTPIKVEMVRPMGKVGFWKILSYGFQAMTNKKAKIKDINLELKDDDQVIVGSPIWNDRLSTPINTVLAKYTFNKETTEFVLYPAGEGTKKSIKILKKKGFVKEPIVISNPLKNKNKVKELSSKVAA